MMDSYQTPIIIYLLFLHFVGDFVFQTRWMANNKGSKASALLLHILAYSLVLAVGMSYFLTKASWELVATYVGANAVLHLFTDAVTSKYTRHYHAQGNEKAFFTTIGFDQFIHAACLIGTFFLVFLWK